MESKSVRNLDLNFSALPRGNKKHQQPTNNNEHYEEPVPEVKKPINTMNEQEFPMLSSNGAAAANFAAPPRVTVANKIGKAGLAKTDENFPSLGPTSSVPPLSMPKVQKPTVKTTVAHALKPNHVATRPQEVKNVPKKDTKKPSTLQNNHHVEKKDPHLYEDFPSLPVTKNLSKVLKFPAQNNKSAVNLIEYSTLAKAEPKLRLVNTENVQKSNEKPKPASLNINSDLNFPSLGISKHSDAAGGPTSIRERDPKMTPLTLNKPLKNKSSNKNFRKNEETMTNTYTVLQGGTPSPSMQYIRPPNEENRNKVSDFCNVSNVFLIILIKSRN